jgi:diguanylate cyclase (GGDEF)-like protein
MTMHPVRNAPQPSVVQLQPHSLNAFMPMFLAVDMAGTITAAGKTIAKLFAEAPLIGAPLFAVFDLRRVGPITTIAALVARAAQPLTLMRRDGGGTLRGLALPMADGQGVLFNLSFGIGVIDAVRQFGLTDADFAATDLAIELLYVVEAKSAVMGELDRLNQSLKGAKSVAEARALTDTLTGLGNRRAHDLALADVIAKGKRFAMLHLDLDFFKAVNDTRGHAAGDHVLRSVAGTLRAATRDHDLVTRVGGDEFVIILTRPPDMAGMMRIAGRMIAGLKVPIPWEGEMCRISGSIGITVSSDYTQVQGDAMQADADAALYAAKRAGRGQAMFAVARAGNERGEAVGDVGLPGRAAVGDAHAQQAKMEDATHPAAVPRGG